MKPQSSVLLFVALSVFVAVAWMSSSSTSSASSAATLSPPSAVQPPQQQPPATRSPPIRDELEVAVDCSSKQHVPHEKSTTPRFATRALTFNPFQPWFGLTNQMISYSSALRFALEENRSVLFPAHSKPDETALGLVPFHHLFNATTTFRILRRVIADTDQNNIMHQLYWARQGNDDSDDITVIVPESAIPFTSANKKNLFLPNRDSYRADPASSAVRGARVYLQRLHKKSHEIPFIRHHNFFSRYPWAALDSGRRKRGGTDRIATSNNMSSFPLLDEAFFLNALQPTDVIEDAWLDLAKSMAAWVREKILSSAANNDDNDRNGVGGGFNVRVGFVGQRDRHKLPDEVKADNEHRQVAASEHDCRNRTSCVDWARRFVTAVHLRIEEDAALLVNKLPTLQRVMHWLQHVVLPTELTRQHEKQRAMHVFGMRMPLPPPIVLYLCIGNWPSPEFEAQMEKFVTELETLHSANFVHILWRSRLQDMAARGLLLKRLSSLDRLPRAVGQQRTVHKGTASRTQDHFRSFVDFLFLSRACRSVLSSHSSLKYPVFARRCYPPHAEVREWLECNDNNNDDTMLMPPRHQRWWSARGPLFDDDSTLVSTVNPRTGTLYPRLEVVRCSERAVGWAGHKSWGN